MPANRFCKGKYRASKQAGGCCQRMVRTDRKEYLDENKRRSLPDEEKLPDMLAFLK